MGILYINVKMNFLKYFDVNPNYINIIVVHCLECYYIIAAAIHKSIYRSLWDNST